MGLLLLGSRDLELVAKKVRIESNIVSNDSEVNNSFDGRDCNNRVSNNKIVSTKHKFLDFMEKLTSMSYPSKKC